MLSERNSRAVTRPILLSAVLTALLITPLPAEGPAWIDKEPSQWTEQDAQQLLKSSPWAHDTGAVIARAEGVWVERKGSHYDRFREWLATQDAEAAQAPPGDGQITDTGRPAAST